MSDIIMEEHKQACIDLTAAYRFFVVENYHEETWNHHALSLPSGPISILATPEGQYWSEGWASKNHSSIGVNPTLRSTL